MAKSEPRTMRFTSEAEAYINKFEGANFTEKFHNAVKFFDKAEKEKNDRIKYLDKEISNREKRLKELSDMLAKNDWLERHFQNLKRSIEQCQGYLDSYVIRK